MKILALDLGASMGVAHNNGPDLSAFSWKLKGDNREQRLAALSDYLELLLNTPADFETVIYERPGFLKGLHATRNLWGYAGVIEAVSTKSGCAVLDVVPTTVKKHATGSGKAKKADMIAWAKRVHGKTLDEHAADALAVLDYAMKNVIRGAL